MKPANSYMKYFIFYFLIFLIFFTVLISFKKKTLTPGKTYMPDMAYSKAYENYSVNPNFLDNMTARTPVEGTIHKDKIQYYYPNTMEGYELAGQELNNPVQPTPEVLKEGKRLFLIYCAVCHGPKGEGDGKMILNDVFPPPPAYSSERLKDLPEGKIYHSITFGKFGTLMHSHACQLDPKERWMVVRFVQTLQKSASDNWIDNNSVSIIKTRNNNIEPVGDGQDKEHRKNMRQADDYQD